MPKHYLIELTTEIAVVLDDKESEQNLYQDMKEHPNHFQVGILAKDVSPEALPCLEKKIITKKRSYTYA